MQIRLTTAKSLRRYLKLLDVNVYYESAFTRRNDDSYESTFRQNSSAFDEFLEMQQRRIKSLDFSRSFNQGVQTLKGLEVIIFK